MANRATVRMNGKSFFDFGQQNEPQDTQPTAEGTIYHILTEAPSIRDYSGFGPFHCVKATVPSVAKKLAEMSPIGLSLFIDVLPQWESGGVVHIKAPLGDGSNMLLRLVEERNPVVAAALPGPAWTVRKSQWNTDFTEDGHEFEVARTYLQKQHAFDAARRVMSELFAGEPGTRSKELITERGNLSIVGMTRHSSYLVDATYDSGEAPIDTSADAAFHDESEELIRVCYGCGAESGHNGSLLKRCAQCKEVWYCSQQCQRKDWKEHKMSCRKAPSDAQAS